MGHSEYQQVHNEPTGLRMSGVDSPEDDWENEEFEDFDDFDDKWDADTDSEVEAPGVPRAHLKTSRSGSALLQSAATAALSRGGGDMSDHLAPPVTYV